MSTAATTVDGFLIAIVSVFRITPLMRASERRILVMADLAAAAAVVVAAVLATAQLAAAAAELELQAPAVELAAPLTEVGRAWTRCHSFVGVMTERHP